MPFLLVFCMLFSLKGGVDGNYFVVDNDSISKVYLASSGKFSYEYRPSLSCHLWHDYSGQWYLENDTLLLSYEKVVLDVEIELSEIKMSIEEKQETDYLELRYWMKSDSRFISLATNRLEPGLEFKKR